MIYVVAQVTVKPGKKEKYLEIFKGIMPTVHAEKGCIEYFPTEDENIGWPVQVLDENRITILEKWESAEDLETHNKASHMEQYRKETKDLIEKAELLILRDV